MNCYHVEPQRRVPFMEDCEKHQSAMKYVQKYEAQLIPWKDFSQQNRNIRINIHDAWLKTALNTHVDETAMRCFHLFCWIQLATPLVYKNSHFITNNFSCTKRSQYKAQTCTSQVPFSKTGLEELMSCSTPESTERLTFWKSLEWLNCTML